MKYPVQFSSVHFSSGEQRHLYLMACGKHMMYSDSDNSESFVMYNLSLVTCEACLATDLVRNRILEQELTK